MNVGVISDTHGLLRPEALAALEGSEAILHAGDVDKPDILEALERVAPVTAVRGNVDHGKWAEALPETVTVDWAGVRIHMRHDRAALRIDLAEENVGVVVFGHTHKPLVEKSNGILFLNPGAAGPRRFRLPVSLARLRLNDGRAEAELITLEA